MKSTHRDEKSPIGLRLNLISQYDFFFSCERSIHSFYPICHSDPNDRLNKYYCLRSMIPFPKQMCHETIYLRLIVFGLFHNFLTLPDPV